jgi:galactosamine-6-phosphate isomerase/glucosamine-6-phosphate deaminase
MKIEISKTYADMSVATANFIAKQLHKKPKSLLCFPSGDTPTGTLKILVNDSLEGKIDFSQCHFIGLDEWVGMDRHDEGSCQHYMFTQFFNPAKIRPEQITFFDAKAKDLGAECNHIDKMIFQRGGFDLIVVGVGMNGHVGLNEPGTSFETYCHSRALEETTKNVGQKYFSSSTPLTEGITVGLKHMMEAQTMVVIASGEKKSGIIQKIIEGPITEQVPGSILQRHENAVFFLDEAAASRLGSI